MSETKSTVYSFRGIKSQGLAGKKLKVEWFLGRPALYYRSDSSQDWIVWDESILANSLWESVRCFVFNMVPAINGEAKRRAARRAFKKLTFNGRMTG